MGDKRVGFILLLIFVSVVLPNIEKVNAGSTVYIRVDGSIDPVTAPISTVDNILYTLTGDIHDSIVVERNNIVIDGNGYKVQGTGNGTGIDLTNRYGVTIKNTQIKDFEYGINVVRSDNNNITANNVTNCYDGIRIQDTEFVTVTENTVTISAHRGIAMVRSSNGTIYGNTLTNSEYGIVSYIGSDLTVSGNNLTDSYVGIYSYGVSSTTVSENTIIDSTVLGFEIYGSFNSTFSSNIVKNSEHGVYFWNTSDTDFSGNTITDITTVGFSLYSSSTNTVRGNTLTNNFRGIYLWTVSNNTVSGNTVTGSIAEGIRIDIASDCVVTANIVTNNKDGVYFDNVSNSTISGNMLSTARGSNVISQSSYVTVFDNFIVNNAIGFSVSQSNNIIFYNNNFVNNGFQIYSSTINGWLNDFPSESNYWSDYTERYPEAEELNGSAIWDTPYVMTLGNQDNYPLMEPYSYELMIITTDGGTTDPPSGKHYYPAGSLVNVTMSPNPGYEFGYWLFDSIETVENSITMIMDGNHTLEAFFVDINPPTTSHDYDGTWHNSDITITLSAIDNESGVSETYYRINDGATKTVSADGQPIIDKENANNTLQYWSIDNAGNEETPNTLTDIRLDKTAPTSLVDLTAATENNGWFTSDVTVSMSATDSLSGVDKTEYNLDSGSWETYVSQFTIVDEGIFSVYYSSVDKAGNVETVNVGTVNLDKTTPQASITVNENATTADAGQNQTVNIDTPITFNASTSSDNIGVVSYSWDFGDGTADTTETTTHTYNTTGNYTVTLTIEDSAGNTNSAQITVTVTSPELLPLWMIGVIAAAVILGVIALVFYMKKGKKVKIYPKKIKQ